MRSSLELRGFYCLFLDDWARWKCSVHPTSGNYELVSATDGQRIHAPEIKLLLLFGEPQRPIAAPEDVPYQTFEYDALLFGLCSLAAPLVASRWSYVLATYSDSTQRADQPGSDPLGLGTLRARLAERGAIEAAVFMDSAVYLRADGSTGVIDNIGAVPIPLPVTIALRAGSMEFVPFVGLIPEWLPFEGEFAQAMLDRLSSDERLAYCPLECTAPARPTDRAERMTIVAHRRERPVVHITHCARSAGIDVATFDLTHLYSSRCAGEEFEAALVALQKAELVYARALLVVAPGEEGAGPAVGRHVRMLRVLQQRCSTTLNPPAAGPTNSAKPAHVALLASQGLSVPVSLATNDPDAAATFLATHPGAVFKSASWLRSIAVRATTDDLARLESLRLCPTLFQEFVEGPDCRAHVVWDRVFPVQLQSSATDYRAAKRGTRASPVTLPAPLVERLVEASADVGLGLSGCDLKWHSERGIWIALEINRMPAFDTYDHVIQNQIANSILDRVRRQ